jgi:hypothetical protein
LEHLPRKNLLDCTLGNFFNKILFFEKVVERGAYVWICHDSLSFSGLSRQFKKDWPDALAP